MGIVNDLLGLTCYPDGTLHRFTMCFWRKSYQKCWRISCCQSGETWFQVDRTVADFACQGPRTSDRLLQCHWIGWGRQMACPPRLPDLIPVDLFVWGHTKALISMSPVDSEDLLAHIVEAAATRHF